MIFIGAPAAIARKASVAVVVAADAARYDGLRSGDAAGDIQDGQFEAPFPKKSRFIAELESIALRAGTGVDKIQRRQLAVTVGGPRAGTTSANQQTKNYDLRMMFL